MKEIQHYVHSIDPFAFQFFGDVGVRWYGLAYLAGIVLGYYFLKYLSLKGRTEFKVKEISDFATYCAIGILAGGRVGYCLFYAPELLTSFSSSFPFWGVLEVHRGGMASHGGILGVMVACIFFARKHKKTFWHILDVTTVGAALGFMFGRLANFINGELYGRQAPESLSWAVKFPQEMTEWVNSGAKASLFKLSSVAESLQNYSGTLINESLWRDWVSQLGSNPSAREKVISFVSWLQNQAMNGNQKVLELLQGPLTPRYPSQLIQAFLEGFLVCVLIFILWRTPKKTGVIAGCFGLAYAIARIIGEQYRMPDSYIGYELFGLTRGQWLSVAMAIIAVGIIIMRQKSNAKKLGGWS